jgi:hypothetical protein
MAFIKAAYAAVRVLAAVSIFLSKSASELPELLPTTPRYSLKNFEGNPHPLSGNGSYNRGTRVASRFSELTEF